MIRLPIAVIEPGSPPHFPPTTQALSEPNGLLAIGGDLAPERLLAAYRRGIFPWFGEGDPILWWSPDPRCVFHTDAVHVSRSLRRQLRHSSWSVSLDRAFHEVMQACARSRPGQPGTWIIPTMIDAYTELHRLGHAHSVEVWDGSELVGGIYGVAAGRLFCAESMFSAQTGGSKIALLTLAKALQSWAMPLLDAQIPNPHLASLGAMTLPRGKFLQIATALGTTAAHPSAWRSLAVYHARDLAPS